MRKVILLLGLVLQVIIAVSYTHLDVYKRQDSLFPLPLPIARLSCIGALSLAGKGPLSFLSVGCTGIFPDHAIVGFLSLIHISLVTGTAK